MDRPIAGYINLCESALMSNDVRKLISTTKHEAIHAIAFTPSLFGYWRDSAGDPRTARDAGGRPLNNEAGTSTITTTNYTWSTANGDITHTVSIMVTPEVVKAVREHFTCPTLLGSEIENQGGSGTAGAHWEQRIFGNEGMVGTFSSVGALTFSKVTLAALQDSGWYAVNYSMAEPLHWGRGLGCDFVTRSCLGWSNAIAPSNPRPFCFSLNSSLLICNDDYSGIGICQISGYSQALPLDYQYFDSDPGLGTNVDRIGGTLQGADFCPVVPSFSNKVCTGSAPGFNTFDLQIYSPDSRCFTQPSRWSEGSSTQIAFGAGCHRFQCTPYGILIYVGNRFYNCSSEASNSILTFTNLDVNGTSYSGSIKCPPCEEICWDMLHLCSPSSIPQTTPPPQTGGMTTSSQTGGMTTSPQTGGMTTPPQTGSMTTPPQTEGMTTPLQTGGMTTLLQTGVVITPPQTGSMTTPPQTGGMTTPPQTGSLTTPPQTGGMTTPQTGGMTTPPQTGGMTTPPQTGGMTTPPQTGGMTTPPQTGVMTTPPQTGGMTTSPQTGGMTTSPQTGGTLPTSGCIKICMDCFWLIFVIYLGAVIF